jgi:hypothetical protein
MKKTLCIKRIHNNDYFYLAFRKNGKLTFSYLGRIDSMKFKHYLYLLTQTSGLDGIAIAKRQNFACGLPVVSSTDGYLVFEYKSGVKEYRDKRNNTVKVIYPHE